MSEPTRAEGDACCDSCGVGFEVGHCGTCYDAAEERARLAEQERDDLKARADMMDHIEWHRGMRAEVERLQGERDEARAEHNQEALDHRNTVQAAMETRERLQGELAGLREAVVTIRGKAQMGGKGEWIFIDPWEWAALAPQEGAEKGTKG